MNLPRAGQSQPKGRIRPAGRKMPRSGVKIEFCPLDWYSSSPTAILLYNRIYMFLRTRGMTRLNLRSQVFENSNCFGSTKEFNGV